MTLRMVREALGAQVEAMQFTLALLAGEMVAEDVGSIRWYAGHRSAFKPFRLEYLVPGKTSTWRVCRWAPTMRGACANGTHVARSEGGRWRVVHRCEVVAEWDGDTLGA